MAYLTGANRQRRTSRRRSCHSETFVQKQAFHTPKIWRVAQREARAGSLTARHTRPKYPAASPFRTPARQVPRPSRQARAPSWPDKEATRGENFLPSPSSIPSTTPDAIPHLWQIIASAESPGHRPLPSLHCGRHSRTARLTPTRPLHLPPFVAAPSTSATHHTSHRINSIEKSADLDSMAQERRPRGTRRALAAEVEWP